MAIQDEIQLLAPSAIVEMFVLDTSMMPDGSMLRFHSGIGEIKSALTWQGKVYQPLPIEAEGFDLTAGGSLPRPKIRVANVEGLFSAAIAEMDDLVGCKIIRKRTMAKFLDAVNFKNGNPFADPMQEFPDQLWFIDKKNSENKYMIEWELASAFDLQGVMLPFRQVIQNSCCWKYRSEECGYVGPYYDKADKPTGNKDEDYCSKRLSSCQVRFGNSEALRFGGFPGVQRNV